MAARRQSPISMKFSPVANSGTAAQGRIDAPTVIVLIALVHHGGVACLVVEVVAIVSEDVKDLAVLVGQDQVSSVRITEAEVPNLKEAIPERDANGRPRTEAPGLVVAPRPRVQGGVAPVDHGRPPSMVSVRNTEVGVIHGSQPEVPDLNEAGAEGDAVGEAGGTAPGAEI